MPLLIVLSGPSGVGKDSVLNQMRNADYPFCYVVTATTRQPRPGEVNGKDYLFTSEEKFHQMREKGELLEWAKVYQHWYGVPRAPVEKALLEGKNVIVKVDVQGAETIKKILPEAILIFLAPPSWEDLERRLRKRKSESPGEFELRIKTAQAEMERASSFDYVIVNCEGEIASTVSQIVATIAKEKQLKTT
jgi:guanylate kinase